MCDGFDIPAEAECLPSGQREQGNACTLCPLPHAEPSPELPFCLGGATVSTSAPTRNATL